MGTARAALPTGIVGRQPGRRRGQRFISTDQLNNMLRLIINVEYEHLEGGMAR
jgi:hypothetical protein